MISRCVIARDSSNLQGGGIYCRGYPSPTIENCTISGNFSNVGAGIFIWDSAPTIVNTIVEGNIQGGAIYFYSAANTSVTYCDFHHNLNQNFTGTSIPQGLGMVNSVNLNGDPCDMFFNIYLNPHFQATTGDSAFRLTADSPCIDAGNPSSPSDPDGTVADIGAFYFHHGGPLSITLTPYNPPIQIPANGGAFEFNIELTNNSGTPQTFDLWTQIELPGTGSVEILIVVDITLPAGVSVDRDFMQEVPVFAPTGNYTYYGYLGDYPWVIEAFDSFTFEKLGGDGNVFLGSPSDWLCTGEAFSDEDMFTIHPSEFILHPPHPNPFNPETSLTFDLPHPGDVSLIIYDMLGREAARLVDGFHPAGYYEMRWIAVNMPSGVYFARLTADGFSQTRKLLLMK